MGKKYNGSISLFAAMIFLLVVSVITATITSARVQGAKVRVKLAASMALDSVFAAYDSELFSKFGILLFDGSMGGDFARNESIAGKLSEYMEYNIDSNKKINYPNITDLLGINLTGVTVKRMIKATDAGGLLWQDMAVDYEKYAKPIDLVADYLGIGDKNEEATAVEEINNSIVECTKQVKRINESAIELIGYIDGVIVPGDGIDFNHVKVSPYSVKRFCPFEISMENLHINNSSVYEKVKVIASNPQDTLDFARRCVENNDKTSLKSTMDKFQSLIDSTLEVMDKADKTLIKIEGQNEKLNNDINYLDKFIGEKEEILSEESMSEIADEVKCLKEYKEIMAQDICDAELIKSSITQDYGIIKQMAVEMQEFDYDEDKEVILEKIDNLRNLLNDYTFEGMDFEYKNLEYTPGEDSKILDSLEEFLETGILSLVVPSDMKISEKKFEEYEDMASSVCDTGSVSEYQKDSNIATITGKKVVYNEYVMDNFSSFTDKDSDGTLDYEIEYILYGGESDKENLTKAVLSIAALRSGINMLYLMTDSDKKQEAYLLASSMAGAYRVEPVIKIIQYTLMYLWSFAEGLSDVKLLLKGEKIELLKTEETWQLTLDNLLSHNIKAEKGSKNGMNYETYLRFLMMLGNDGKKAAYTMDLIELYMIQKGRKDFRFRNYIYGLEIEAAYKVEGLEIPYTETAVYSY